MDPAAPLASAAPSRACATCPSRAPAAACDQDAACGRDRVAPTALSRRLVVVLAVACGAAVANLYYAQPLLRAIAADLGVGAAQAGLVVTLTQIGYAAGLVLIVPLGDLAERRRLVVRVVLGTSLCLAGAALAPDLGVLALASLAVGSLSVVAQVLVPFAATLASEDQRGRVVGQVMSGLLLGILLARTLAGVVAQLAGWRAVYWLAAGLMVVLAAVLHRQLPESRPTPGSLSYRSLLASVGRLMLEEPVLRRRSAYGASIFATFSVVWTSLAFLLSGSPYHYSQAVIGLFGLAGVAGALCASVAGRLADRGLARLSTGAFLAMATAAWALLELGGHRVVALVAGIVLLDLGVQGAHITNQSQVYRLRPEAQSRLTTAYITSYFVGGAAGSALSALVYARAGWTGVCLLGLAFAGAGLGLWLTELRTADPADGGGHGGGEVGSDFDPEPGRCGEPR